MKANYLFLIYITFLFSGCFFRLVPVVSKKKFSAHKEFTGHKFIKLNGAYRCEWEWVPPYIPSGSRDYTFCSDGSVGTKGDRIERWCGYWVFGDTVYIQEFEERNEDSFLKIYRPRLTIMVKNGDSSLICIQYKGRKDNIDSSSNREHNFKLPATFTFKAGIIKYDSSKA